MQTPGTSSTGGPTSPATQLVPVVTKTGVDWQHIGIVVAFVLGVVYGAKSLVLMLVSGHAPPMGLVGVFVTLTVTAVAAFIKDKPGSWQVAFTDGDQVSEEKKT